MSERRSNGSNIYPQPPNLDGLHINIAAILRSQGRQRAAGFRLYDPQVRKYVNIDVETDWTAAQNGPGEIVLTVDFSGNKMTDDELDAINALAGAAHRHSTTRNPIRYVGPETFDQSFEGDE